MSSYTAMMANPKPNQLMTCPYNKAHQVEHYRMVVHLSKCRKQHLNQNKMLCPIDSSHVINDVELDFHVTCCPKRQMLDVQMFITDDDFTPNVDVPAAPVVPSEEDWDADGNQSYVPDSSKIGTHIITKARGVTPSQRRQARMEGIRTFQLKSSNEE